MCVLSSAHAPIWPYLLALSFVMSGRSNVYAAEAPSEGPSFACSHATSTVNRMICASPQLSLLDKKLASDYEATLHQGGIDAKTLQSDEEQWLRNIRNRCATVRCLTEVYEARDDAILATSLKAASPAAYEDTRPFAASPAALSAARALIGTACDGAPVQPLPRTTQIDHFRVITARGAYIVPLNMAGEPFAFLLIASETTPSECTVRDVVALPPLAGGNRFLQCHLGEDSHGFAMRSSAGTTLAYWSIREDLKGLQREPIHVLGEQDLHCQEPETGE